jgi:hypothetical protein
MYNYKPIAILSVSAFGGLNIWAVDNTIEDKVLVSMDNGPRRWCRVHIDRDGNSYIVRYRQKYMLSDFMRV